MIRQIAGLATIAIILFGCKDNNETTVQLTTAGLENFGTVASTTGVVTSWTNDNKNEIGTTTVVVNCGYVDGSDVYHAGRSNPASLNLQPAFWKNGVETILADSGDVDHIFVSNGDVYCTGYTIKDQRIVPTYWKNSTAFPLGAPYRYNQRVTSTYVSGNDSYVLGYYPSFMPLFWKNGVEQDLPQIDGHIQFEITASYFDGNNIHFTGDLTGDSFYWDGSQSYPLKLSQDAVYSETHSLFINGNDVYVAGKQRIGVKQTSVATYWKNGEPVILDGGYETVSIKLKGNDVYVLGYKFKDDQRKVPVFWKNGAEMPLELTTDRVYKAFDFSIR